MPKVMQPVHAAGQNLDSDDDLSQPGTGLKVSGWFIVTGEGRVGKGLECTTPTQGA